LNREYEIKESFSETGYPNQNPVESQAIKWLKKAGERLLNHTGAPDFVWIWAYQYLALINHWTAGRTLRWKCPYTKRHGVTPDISALLSFHFYEPVYYLDVEEPAPLSKEKAGHWLGVAQNVGDALTYHILTDDTQQVIQRSVIRSRNDRYGVNKRVTFNPNLEPAVTLNHDNQNIQHQRPVTFSSGEFPVDRQHRRLRRKQSEHPRRRNMDGRIRAEGQMQETGEVERRTLHEVLEDAIDQTDPCIDVDDGTDEIAMEPVEGDNVDDPTIRRSTRRTKTTFEIRKCGDDWYTSSKVLQQ
jgi:hypothetical protein